MIEVAIQRGSYVYVYGERNRLLFSKNGILHGFTASTVSVKRGNYVYTYNEKGNQVSSHYTR